MPSVTISASMSTNKVCVAITLKTGCIVYVTR